MKTTALCLLAFLGFGAGSRAQVSLALPAVFENDLITLAIPLDGDTLLMYTDTGGKNFLYKTGLQKLGAKRSRKNLWETAPLERLMIAQGIPLPGAKELYFTNDKSSHCDGMLGRQWFADKAWAFDYADKSLKYIEAPEAPTNSNHQTVPLHFKFDASGQRTSHLPAIDIVVGADTLAMLFDTGAQAFLSPAAQSALGKDELVAISFINAATFDRWRHAYPEWLVIPGGDLSFGEKADLIRVPEVHIGATAVGPVAFAKRADANFELMSRRFMDREIAGALGGNALSGLHRFIVDYRHAELRIKK